MVGRLTLDQVVKVRVLAPQLPRPPWEDAGVYVSLTRASTADQPIENATIVAEEMLRWFREMDGFEGLLFLSREGTTLGLTFWESREVAERHRVARMQFRDRMTSAAMVQVEETVDYEVTFAHLGPGLTESG
jgi:hypothetical protein